MRARVAWFTPMPPVRSGIADYSLEILPLLGNGYDIDVFVDEESAGGERPGPSGSDRPNVSNVTVLGAHDFLWRHTRRPYDVIVYQLGNAPCHDYMWPYLVRFPGLVVLHGVRRSSVWRMRHEPSPTTTSPAWMPTLAAGPSTARTCTPAS